MKLRRNKKEEVLLIFNLSKLWKNVCKVGFLLTYIGFVYFAYKFFLLFMYVSALDNPAYPMNPFWDDVLTVLFVGCGVPTLVFLRSFFLCQIFPKKLRNTY